jgi:hypothetical protein
MWVVALVRDLAVANVELYWDSEESAEAAESRAELRACDCGLRARTKVAVVAGELVHWGAASSVGIAEGFAEGVAAGNSGLGTEMTVPAGTEMTGPAETELVVVVPGIEQE